MKTQFVTLLLLLCVLGCKVPLQYGKVDSGIINQKKLEWKLEKLPESKLLSFRLESRNDQFSLLCLRIDENMKKGDLSFQTPSTDSVFVEILHPNVSEEGWVRVRKLAQGSYFIAGYFVFSNGDSMFQGGVLKADGKKVQGHRYHIEVFQDKFHLVTLFEDDIENACLFINGIYIPVGYNFNWESEGYMNGPWYTTCENGGENDECGIYGGYPNLSDLARNYISATGNRFLQ